MTANELMAEIRPDLQETLGDLYEMSGGFRLSMGAAPYVHIDNLISVSLTARSSNVSQKITMDKTLFHENATYRSGMMRHLISCLKQEMKKDAKSRR